MCLFPDAIPATEAVIRDMWSNMRPVTPAAFPGGSEHPENTAVAVWHCR